MANNRLYIGCKECGDWCYLDKHFGNPFHLSEESFEKFNEFLEAHAYCGRSDEMTMELFDECGSDMKTWTFYMSKKEDDDGHKDND